ncbi:TraB/GumN family protein [Pedobacter ureilyticus]|uniref:TraB/GumN family protein n=1 Tax=Pedobacter ureilyticus TaxID=1393051 RepID=A0ABW9J0D2_9SPHI|nr:TraB/GumN family protein [Pedobacter helvus]
MRPSIKSTSSSTFKLALLIIGLFVVIHNASAQKSNSSLLWKIEGKELQKPSYLFGTNHMLCESDYRMPQKVKDAMQATDQAYLEINLGDPNVTAEMQKHMAASQPLSTSVSKEDAVYIDSLLKLKLKVGLQQVDNLKPLLIVSSLMQTSLPCKVISFESEIVKVSKAANKEVKGLSSVEEQYSFLDKIFKPKDFVPYLKMWTDEELKKSFNTIKTAYLAEDLATIDSLMAAFYTSDPEGYHNLLPMRNHLWADRIPTIIKEKPTFFAVGCGHLQGKEGMIALLQAKGYKVTPVK